MTITELAKNKADLKRKHIALLKEEIRNLEYVIENELKDTPKTNCKPE